MASNYVEIKIKASDTAKPDLTDLKLKLDEVGSKVETARVDVDDEDASVKLLRLNARLAELNRKVSNPRIKVDGAAQAEAEIAAIDLEMDRLNDKANSAGPTGLLGKILGGASGAVPSEGIFGTLLGPAGIAIVPVIGAIATELVGLASGFAAAGAGAGAFGLLAAPAVKHVETAYTALSAAQAKYQAAQAKEAADPTKGNAAALKTAALNLKLAQESLGKMPASEQGAIKGVQGLVAEFGKLSKAFEPQAFKVFNDALKIANDLLPAITPFANSFANALDGLLKHVDKFAKSKGFQDWLKQFGSLVGPAVTAIGNGIGKVLPALGKLLTLMSKKDVVNAINIAFTVLADTIRVITAAIHRFMENWDGMSRTVTRDARDVAKSFDAMRHDIAAAFDNVRHGLADSAHSWASTFDRMRHDIAAWAADVVRFGGRVVNWFRGLPHRIVAAVGNLGSLLFNAGRSVIQGLINGIGSMIGAVGSAIGNIVGEIRNFLPFSPAKKGPLSGAGAPSASGRSIALQLAQGMESGLGPVRSAAGHLAGSAGIAGGVSGGGGHAVIQIAPKGGSGLEQQFWTWLKNGVRAQGGDPSMFQRKVAFR